MSVDGSFIQANADHHSRVPREQLPEIAKLNHTVREYLVELERENPVEPRVAPQEKVSTTDPDSTYATRCRECSQKSRCTRGKYRTLAIHTCEPARQRAHALAQTPGFAISQRARRKVEALFAELKNYIGLRRLRLRRMRFVREQFYLAATVQNLKRLVRFLSSKPTPQIATA